MWGASGIRFSLCGLAVPWTKPHRLKSLCDNSISDRSAAKAAMILSTLRHG